MISSASVDHLVEVLERGRTLDRADGLARQVLDAADALGVAGGDHDVLAGDVVRTGEPDQLLAGVVDGVGRDDHVDGVLLQERLAVGGHGLLELDVVGATLAPDALGDEPGDLGVEALDAARGLDTEQRLVVLHADAQRPGLLDRGHGRALLELGGLGRRAGLAVVRGPVVAAVVAAGGGQQRERGSGGDQPRCLVQRSHVSFLRRRRGRPRRRWLWCPAPRAAERGTASGPGSSRGSPGRGRSADR